MKKIAISAAATFASLMSLGHGAEADARPRIVVGIVVDQLRTDYIEDLRDYFGERGFRALMDEGVYIRDVDFGYTPTDAAMATASLYTGAWPANTGVPSAMIGDPENPAVQSRPALTQVGKIINNDSFTPEGLRLTTLADEVAVAGAGLSGVYSISADPQQAVILAGHAGNGAIWLNNTSGNWATSTYYGTLPAAASTRNIRQSLSSRVDTMQWRPTRAATTFLGSAGSGRNAAFQHKFSSGDRDVYKKLAASPRGNDEITDVAIELLRQLSNSGHSETDMVNIGYTVAPYKYSTGRPEAESADTYIRLDRQLARLFEAVDKYYGKGNALIWVTSTGYYDEALLDERRYRLPSGEFSVKKARSLLNSYLSARHGSAGYVESIRDRNVYLNRKAIDERGLDRRRIVEDARDFLSKMCGVDRVMTLSEILAPTTPETEMIRRVTDTSLSGDLYVEYTPGWSVVDDEQYPSVKKSFTGVPVMTPAFLLGFGLRPEVIETPVEATALAPTVAGILRIRSPNGARSRSLQIGRRK